MKAGDGLTEDLGWGMSMPEMEGCIDPIMLGATRTTPEELCRELPYLAGADLSQDA